MKKIIIMLTILSSLSFSACLGGSSSSSVAAGSGKAVNTGLR